MLPISNSYNKKQLCVCTMRIGNANRKPKTICHLQKWLEKKGVTWHPNELIRPMGLLWAVHKSVKNVAYQMKSLQWQQKVGCLKNRGINLWSLISQIFFFLRAPFRCLAAPLSSLSVPFSAELAPVSLSFSSTAIALSLSLGEQWLTWMEREFRGLSNICMLLWRAHA